MQPTCLRGGLRPQASSASQRRCPGRSLAVPPAGSRVLHLHASPLPLVPQTCFTSRLSHTRCNAAAAEVEAYGGASPVVDSAEALSSFLGWLVSNGVQGLGTAQSKVGLYEGETGERGFVCTQDITSGEELLRVPLRLALTAYEDDPDNQVLYEGAPWSVQLSAKLLREVKAGSKSPWWPYLQVLPARVPAPLETFSWEDMQQIQYVPGQAKLYEYQWLVADAYAQCPPEALGGASEEQFQWAMSIVHSRTFGNASPSGGVGVHMLVPLVDMLNHGGDETRSGLLADPVTEPTDNVRWDVVQGAGDAWDMVVSATADVAAGDQLLLSYGERCSDDFFIHYGFIPTANPHETVQLFGSLAEALDWHYQAQVEAGQALKEGAEQLYRTALAEAVQQQRQQLALDSKAKQAKRQRKQLESGASSSDNDDTSEEDGKPVLVHAGGRVDPALMLAFGSVYAASLGSGASTAAPGGTQQSSAAPVPAAAGAAVAAAGEPLTAASTAAATAGGAGPEVGPAAGASQAAPAPGVQQHCLLMLRRRCDELLAGLPSSLLQDVALLWGDAMARGDEDAAEVELTVMEHYRKALQSGRAQPSAADGGAAPGPSAAGETPIQVFAWQTYQSARQATAQASTPLPTQESGTSDVGIPSGQPEAGSAAHNPAADLSAAQRLLLRYRVAKKMVLTDAALATAAAVAAASAGVPL